MGVNLRNSRTSRHKHEFQSCCADGGPGRMWMSRRFVAPGIAWLEWQKEEKGQSFGLLAKTVVGGETRTHMANRSH